MTQHCAECTDAATFVRMDVRVLAVPYPISPCRVRAIFSVTFVGHIKNFVEIAELCTAGFWNHSFLSTYARSAAFK